VLDSVFPCKWELILVPNSASDESLEIATSVTKFMTNIRILSDYKRNNISFARNQGMLEARYSFIAWLDSDDISLPHRMTYQYNYLIQNPNVSILAGSVIVINREGVEMYRKEMHHKHDEIVKSLQRWNIISNPSTMVRRSHTLKVGLYSEEYVYAEDYEFWLRSSKKLNFASLPQPVIKYRLHSSSVGGSNLNSQISFAIQAKIALSSHYRLFRLIRSNPRYLKNILTYFDPFYGNAFRWIHNYKASISSLLKRNTLK
jgi:glycosyltransferase involved in cell wall biosynthesis